MKYQTAYIFTKRGNLLPYLYSKSSCFDERTERLYAQERELQLVLLVRIEDRKIYCRIKCPVNPLPIKGEFEVPALGAIENFLNQNGWKRKQVIHSGIFN